MEMASIDMPVLVGIMVLADREIRWLRTRVVAATVIVGVRTRHQTARCGSSAWGQYTDCHDRLRGPRPGLFQI